MAESRGSRTRSKRTGPDKTGHGGAPGPAPFGAVWRNEREDLCVRRDGGIDEAKAKRWYRARKAGDVWARVGPDGMIQIACDPDDPARPIRRSEADAFSASGTPTLIQRHRELERRLREGPYAGDGSDALPVVRFPLSRVEFNELHDLRKLHGCGAEWGEGEVRLYWRPDCDDNIVGRGRKVIPKLVMAGRAA